MGLSDYGISLAPTKLITPIITIGDHLVMF